LSLLAAVALFTVGPLAAQGPSTIDPAALDAAVTTPTADSRAVIGEALSSEQAIAAAATLGLDSDALEARIATLGDEDADRLAERILAGGDSVTISVTAIIIILLLLILIAD
jgi:hypothetical protein